MFVKTIGIFHSLSSYWEFCTLYVALHVDFYVNLWLHCYKINFTSLNRSFISFVTVIISTYSICIVRYNLLLNDKLSISIEQLYFSIWQVQMRQRKLFRNWTEHQWKAAEWEWRYIQTWYNFVPTKWFFIAKILYFDHFNNKNNVFYV